jgi:hypothetical protein
MSKPITLSIENAPDSFFAKVKELRGNDYLDYYKGRFKTVQDNPKRWSIVAITVGALIVLGVGGFGGIGLLHSYGVIGTFPSQLQWLSSAIGTIGNTPHFWSLWVLTGGGIAVGAITLVLGVRALKRANKAGEEVHDEMKAFGEYKKLFAAEFGTVETKLKVKENKIICDNKVGLKIDNGYYNPFWFDPTTNKNDGRGDQRYFILYRDNQGTLHASACMSKKRRDTLIMYLEAIGLKNQEKKK